MRCSSCLESARDKPGPGADSDGRVALQPQAFAPKCDGRVQVNWDECGNAPHQRPAIQQHALEQVHVFIFIMALTHIAAAVLVICLASLRLHWWRHWKVADDAPLTL